MSAQRAPFITLEGIDGAGKSSHMDTIKAALAAAGYHDVVMTREPGGTDLGSRLRMELKETPMSLAAEVMIAFAARAQHLDEVIRPALAAGRAVVSDRFTDSTFAYQGAAKGYPVKALEALEDMVHGDLQPDITLWFDLDPGVAEARRDDRDKGATGDKFDTQPKSWFDDARRGYADRMAKDPYRIVRINAAQPFEAVAQEVGSVLSSRLDKFVAGLADDKPSRPHRAWRPGW